MLIFHYTRLRLTYTCLIFLITILSFYLFYYTKVDFILPVLHQANLNVSWKENYVHLCFLREFIPVQVAQ